MIGKHPPAPGLAIKPVIRIDTPYRLTHWRYGTMVL